MKSYFGVGKIYKHSDNMMRYKVSSIKELILVIIPHFEKYPLMTQKRADFVLFKKAVQIMSKGTGLLTQQELQDIVNLKASLNRGLTPKLKELFPYTVPAERILVKDELDRNNPEHAKWLAGFVEAEGNFHLGITKNNNLLLGEAVILVFTLTQHSRDEVLLTSLVKFFDSGYYNLRKDGLACDYKIADFNSIYNKVVPFFNKYPLYGTKLLNLNEFIKAAEIIKHKEHLTQEGLTRLHGIKARMNILDKAPSLTLIDSTDK